MSQQDPHEVSQLIKALETAKTSRRGGGKQEFSCKKNTYNVKSTGITVDSWKFNDWDYSKPNLPTYARGLFTTKRKDNIPEIAIRGYDKFFNINEQKSTEWPNIEKDTIGPYELSVKENGCIIFMSGLEDGTLLVCSKHSTGARDDAEKSHSVIGERWIEKHLTSVGKTKQDLALALRRLNVTAVGELCDDAFEEHVLAYPPDMAGLYLHGVNFNLPEFATLSGPEVHQFADTWGFKKAQYTMIQDIQDVRQFLEKCAETGSYDGRDTEGFVVRCKLKSTGRSDQRDWFFKYKFDEPYLMYRQWRECTKAVIAGRPPKIRKHKQVTEEYLLYARRQMVKDPSLGKRYNQNHGIIALRDGFLQEKGVRGSDIIAREEAEEKENNEILRDVLLVPIATIGCGKTTVAKALVKLFGWGHVQNDNVQGTKNRPLRFVTQITAEMANHNVVIADRNNHQKRERRQLINDISHINKEAKFVALHYVHEPKNIMINDIRNITARRVLDRGDNHQTIHAGTKSEQEILGIMDGFLQRFEGIDIHHEPDSNFDEVINLDVAASSRENLETVVNHLFHVYPNLFNGDMPTHQDMDDAIAHAMAITVDVQHDLSFGRRDNVPREKSRPVAGKSQTPPAELSTDQLIKRLEYFNVPVSTTVINSLLANMFAQASPEASAMYQHLKQSGRIQDHFHVTMIHRASAATHAHIWQRYTEQYRQRLTQSDTKIKDNYPSLGAARIVLERVVWDSRVMAIVVQVLSGADGSSWDCANQYAHITIGTANPSIKPKESNDLLGRWFSGDVSGDRIWQMEIPGDRVLEGAVKPVMQRGR